MNKTVKVLIVDENRNTITVDMDVWLYKRLNIKKEDIKTHKSHHALNKTVAEFIKNFGND